MQNSDNPYQSPHSPEPHPPAARIALAPKSLARVATGLWQLYLAAVIVLVFFGLSMVDMFHLLPGPIPEGAAAGLASIVIAAAVLDLVGMLFCLATPAATGARGFIIASVATWVASAIVLWTAPGSGEHLGHFGRLLSSILDAVSCVTLLLYLRKLNQFLGRRDLARQAHFVLVGAAGVVVVYFGVFGSAAIAEHIELAPDARKVGTVVIIVGFALTLLAYVNLLRRTRSAILDRVKKS